MSTTLPEGLVSRGGEDFYQVPDVGRLAPFLMSLISDSDLWAFISSRGGLTAGRVDEDHCLFPYETDDQLHLCHGTTGPVTLLRVQRAGGQVQAWEPFTDRYQPGAARRHLYKSAAGHRIVFEEVHDGLGLTFRYEWAAADAFGLVRTAALTNHPGRGPVRVELLDGLLNLLPANLNWMVQQRFSCLLNAYTRCEVDPATGLGIFALQSQLSDKAEPAESLRAAVAWQVGLDEAAVALSSARVQAFREGGRVPAGGDPELKGRRGAYLLGAQFALDDGASRSWRLVADVHRSQVQVEALRARLGDRAAAARELDAALAAAAANLRRFVATADGLQCTADRAATAHHFANVLFNNMRGGVFWQNYDVPAQDFRAFVRERNRAVYQRHEAFLTSLEGTLNYPRLLGDLAARGDASLTRFGYEYLPLTFSRRHGDPSRPWNHFSIRLRHDDGRQLLAYEGNWRDIFQNWEALGASFPEFIESFIAKFLNASTVDGFNPYRLTRAGIDWEVPAPNEPWANLGYWGDHQIIYWAKFLEASRRYHPKLLEAWLDQPRFAYADVPYRLQPYAAIVRDSRNTIAFDAAAAAEVERRVAEIGTDGRLVQGQDGGLLHVTLAEKLLVPILSKLSNLVPDGGIWMNTQRPEWNDANNALAGYGLSMVTLCYLRRHLALCLSILEGQESRTAKISTEVVAWAQRVAAIMAEHQPLLAAREFTDEQRKTLLDALGEAFGAYRQQVYGAGFSGKTPCRLGEIADLFRRALAYLDHAIAANRREDGLYHAYNLLELSPDGKQARIGRLYEMLEGQVAALSSGALDSGQALDVLQALRHSRIWRADQSSYLLYPDRELPRFLARNVIPAALVEGNPLLLALVQAGDSRLLSRDAAGQYRFHADFRNQRDLQAALDALAQDARFAALAAAHRAVVLDVFEQVFHHRAFTGRSGGMYGYEGLGCIYWHMVAKLLLAAQECYWRAVDGGEAEATVRALAEAYHDIRAGLGFNKSAAEFGAIPTDPYSHTPGHAGAQQPGMTGQVKEEILTRWGELGVRVVGGQVHFTPRLLREQEFLTAPAAWECVDREDRAQALSVPAGALGFTFCAAPIVYEWGAGAPAITITDATGAATTIQGAVLDGSQSRRLFERDGGVREIRVRLGGR